MKKCRLPMLVMVMLGTSAAPALSGATAPLIHTQFAEKRPQVQPTGALSCTTLPGGKRSSGATLAARLTVPGRQWHWQPSPDVRSAAANADLLDAALSPDESVLVISERIGGAGNPNSTRLVMVDVRSGAVVKGLEIRERLLVRIDFVPGQEGVICAVAAGQEAFGTGDELLLIDLTQEGVPAGAAALPGIPESAVCGRKFWYASFPGSREIVGVRLDDLAAPPVKILSVIPGGGLLLLRDELLHFGPGRLERFQLTASGVRLRQSRELPAGFAPGWGAALTENGAALLLVEPGKTAQVLSENGAVVAVEKNAAPGWLFPANDLVLLADAKSEELHPLRLPALTAEKAVRPGKVKPMSRNRLFKGFKRGSEVPELILLDARGNVFALRLETKRVRKNALLVVDRTGLK